jgi:hypothetical protein
MKCSAIPLRKVLVIVSLVVAVSAAIDARATKPEKEKPKPRRSGKIEFIEGTLQANFKLKGAEEQVGKFNAEGQLDFVPGQQEGTLDGTGVVVFHAKGGRLVGEVTASLDANNEASQFQFSWRDSITLRNGKTVANTGRFVNQRPTGLTARTSLRPTGLIVIDPPPDIPLIILILIDIFRS